MFKVKGGIFTNTDWNKVQEGTEEEYGPFSTFEQALEAWKRGMFTSKLDTCTHRLFICEA